MTPRRLLKLPLLKKLLLQKKPLKKLPPRKLLRNPTELRISGPPERAVRFSCAICLRTPAAYDMITSIRT
jgi:hypothetical protein